MGLRGIQGLDFLTSSFLASAHAWTFRWNHTAALGHRRWRSPRFPDLEPGFVFSKKLSIF